LVAMEAIKELIVIKDNEHCKMKICLEQSILNVVCKSHHESEELRKNLLELMEIIKAYRIKYLLGDVRSLHYLKVEDSNWLLSNIIPAMKACSLQKWARVENPCSMMELNSLQLKHKLEFEDACRNELQFESFVDEESALHWLLHGDDL
jgi:hypothetical protein